MPPAIVAWDGWRPPTPRDHLRMAVAFEKVFFESGSYPTSSPEWIKVGEDINYPQLRHQALLDTMGYEDDDKQHDEANNPYNQWAHMYRREMITEDYSHSENQRIFDPSRPRG